MEESREKSHEGKTDEELINLILKDQDNFLYLTDRYEDKLLNYIRKISGAGREEAEDILQEVFLKVYLNLHSFNPKLKFSSWIYRITHNQVITNFRRNRSRPEQIFLDEDNEFLSNIASEINLNTEIDQKILKKNLDKILAKMDLKYREVLILRFLEEKDYNEISDILKKPQGSVSSLINRAKKQFLNKSKEDQSKFY